MITCIRSAYGDGSASDLFKGGLRLWRGVHAPLGLPCIGRGVCGLVASLVAVVSGLTHWFLLWLVWADGRGSTAPRGGDVDHLRRAAIRFPAVHQARQPLGIARLGEITHIRRAHETRGRPISRSMRATLAACVTS